MTTIVTTSSEEFATLIGDEGITSDLIHHDMRKIVRQGTWLIAACGEDRICDVVQYVVKYPPVPKYLLKRPADQWYSWVVSQVIPKISAAIEKTMPKAYKNSIGDSQLIIVTHGRAFLIGETLGVTRADPYWSVGSGSHLALGSLTNASKTTTWSTKHLTHAIAAVKTAQRHDPYTRGKITGYISQPDGNIEEANA